MKIKKKLAIVALLAATGLFAATLGEIDMLVDKINNTKDAQVKSELLKKLDAELDTMDKKELPKAHEIVNSKLKQPKLPKK